MSDTIYRRTVSWREGDYDRDPEEVHAKLAEEFWTEVERLAAEPRFVPISVVL